MAITFDASTDFALVNPGTSISGNHTCSGTDRFLLVGTFDTQGASSIITGVTYNGVSLTKIGTGAQVPIDSRWVNLWYLINPASGTHTLEATASASDALKMQAISYAGCKQSGQPDASVTNTETTPGDNDLDLTLTSVLKGCWIAGFCKNDATGTFTSLTGGVLRQNADDTAIGDTDGARAPGSHTLSFVLATASFAGIAISIAPASEDDVIWQLQALTTPATVDLLAVVDDPAGTPITKKLALSDFISTLALSNVVVQTKTVGSGTYTPTSGMKKVLGIAVGAGGGGAGGVNTDSAGGGGGGGGTVIRLMTAADIGASKAYVTGAGGSANNAGTATTLDGGTLMNAGGGSAGTAGATSTTVGTTTAGGAGGTASNGNLNIPGEAGDRGTIFDGTNGYGGAGGGSRFGFGGAMSGSNTAGNNGSLYGGGGGGGHASGTADRAGGNGANGILYLIEFMG